ncbi:hypothetical protein cand_031810 [Cryptosporidium andersoni]|uniref:Uncharacterized protein n=1 Tax=Cryptosporidium andersoni TaxID=117008 RepID=A0A1J4MEM0_9CRYT|nr:hypothetical protein cand_031810 [Cryptosporidium andersoni]
MLDSSNKENSVLAQIGRKSSLYKFIKKLKEPTNQLKSATPSETSESEELNSTISSPSIYNSLNFSPIHQEPEGYEKLGSAITDSSKKFDTDKSRTVSQKKTANQATFIESKYLQPNSTSKKPISKSLEKLYASPKNYRNIYPMFSPYQACETLINCNLTSLCPRTMCICMYNICPNQNYSTSSEVKPWSDQLGCKTCFGRTQQNMLMVARNKVQCKYHCQGSSQAMPYRLPPAIRFNFCNSSNGSLNCYNSSNSFSTCCNICNSCRFCRLNSLNNCCIVYNQ